jgi:hypothetical protein
MVIVSLVTRVAKILAAFAKVFTGSLPLYHLAHLLHQQKLGMLLCRITFAPTGGYHGAELMWNLLFAARTDPWKMAFHRCV